MKRFFDWILDFNNNLDNVASRDNFTSIGLLGLSLASFITTFMGMMSYTDLWPIAFLASLGIQLLMLYGAVRFAILTDRFSPHGFFLLIMFFGGMSVSAFFSFAAFHEAVEPPKRRAEEAQTLLLGEWTDVFGKIRSQTAGEFSQKLSRPGADGKRPYDSWVAEVEGLRGGAAAYVAEGERQTRAEIDRIKLIIPPSIIDSTLSELNTSQRELVALERQIVAKKRQIEDVKVRRDKARADADRELTQGGVNADGRPRRAGNGPTYRALNATASGLEAEYNSLEAELLSLENQKTTLEQATKGYQEQITTAASPTDERIRQQNQRLSIMEAAIGRVKALRAELEKLPSVPAGISGGSIEMMRKEADLIKDAATACVKIIQTYQAGKLDIETANLPYSRQNFEIANKTCGQEPRLIGGGTIGEYVEEFTQLNEECQPSKMAALEHRAFNLQHSPRL